MYDFDYIQFWREVERSCTVLKVLQFWKFCSPGKPCFLETYSHTAVSSNNWLDTFHNHYVSWDTKKTGKKSNPTDIFQCMCSSASPGKKIALFWYGEEHLQREECCKAIKLKHPSEHTEKLIVQPISRLALRLYSQIEKPASAAGLAWYQKAVGSHQVQCAMPPDKYGWHCSLKQLKGNG